MGSSPGPVLRVLRVLAVSRRRFPSKSREEAPSPRESSRQIDMGASRVLGWNTRASPPWGCFSEACRQPAFGILRGPFSMRPHAPVRFLLFLAGCLARRRSEGRFILLAILLALAFVAAAGAADSSVDAPVDFDSQIRPILSDKCYQCHGPDEKQRKADLRLDTHEGALAALGGSVAEHAVDPDKSPLYQRLVTADESERMPPVDSGLTLTEEQRQLIARWIQQGAPWQDHWSFVPPKSRPLPKLEPQHAARHPIDVWVQSRLAQQGLAVAPEADRATLVRRLTLDLTGLPPTLGEAAAFVEDDSADAYERLVERLMASPRFGERMALPWLDAARYADTNGYQTDGPRDMWRWRDWVIDAFNRNLPFDQFTIEQLAGDLLPQPSLSQRIATGFNRNHRGNSEGGIVPEEYEVEYVVDRVETTSTVWLGLTIGCARCHDHKYDPVSQREFYQLYGYFNSVDEHGRALKDGNSPPFISAPTPAQQRREKMLREELAAAVADWDQCQSARGEQQQQWEAAADPKIAADWSVTDGRQQLFEFQINANADPSATFREGAAQHASGRHGQAVDLDGKRFVDAGDVGRFGYFDKFSLAAWVYPVAENAATPPVGGTIVSRMSDVIEDPGYCVVLRDGHIHVNMVKRWLDDAIRVESVDALAANQWHHITVTYDGSRQAKGIAIYVDGRAVPLRIHLDYLNQTFDSKEPFRIGGGNGPTGRFHGRIDDVAIYGRCLSETEVQVVACADPIGDILRVAPSERTPSQSAKLAACHLAMHAPQKLQVAWRRHVDAERALQAFTQSLPTVMVMQDRPTPRQAFLLERGQYDRPGQPVTADVPACLPKFSQDRVANRLQFAHWLVQPSHPLTGRVTVNRVWQTLFGMGLVETAEDFGAQGQRPKHPELLDWLAMDFVRSGWDVKNLVRTIVTSHTYRQSSQFTPETLARDPDNHWLGRGARFRLSAEVLRDQSLAMCGLLFEHLGGPSVRPYQPDGLYKDLASYEEYIQSEGGDLYRRSMYTFWKRTVGPPTMINFDASTREFCVVRKSRTNTPLQALTLMNDITFVEAARELARRMMREGGATPDDRLRFGFRLATAREPRPDELQILRRGFDKNLQAYQKDLAAAAQLLSGASGSQSAVDSASAEGDPAPWAAYTIMASVLLNLDEVIVRG